MGKARDTLPNSLVMATTSQGEWMVVRGRSDESERVKKEGGKSGLEIGPSGERLAVRTRLIKEDYHNLIGAPVVIKDTTSSPSCAHDKLFLSEKDWVNSRSVESPASASEDQLNFENGDWPSMSTECIPPPQLGSWSTAVKKLVNKESKRQVLRIASFICSEDIGILLYRLTCYQEIQ